MPNFKLTVFLTVPMLFAALPAQAYIGPGAGVGTIAVVLGILGSIVMAFFAILWYPLKRLLKKRKVIRPAPSVALSDRSEGSDAS